MLHLAEIFVYKCNCSIRPHDTMTQLVGKQQLIVIKQSNCNQMTARCIQGVILAENTFSIMSVLVLIKSVSHCVKSEQVIQAMSQ